MCWGVWSRYRKWLNRLEDINFRQSVAYGFWNWSSNTLYNATQVCLTPKLSHFLIKRLRFLFSLKNFLTRKEHQQ